MRQPDVPQFSFPLRTINGRFALVEQDDVDEIRDCVEVLVRTPQGSRLEDPDYGITDPTFRDDYDDSEIRDAIADHEPRAAALVDSEIDVEEMARTINVEVGTRD